MTIEQREYIDRLIDGFRKAEINDNGLIQMTPELRDRIVLELEETRKSHCKEYIVGIDLAEGKDMTVYSPPYK